MCPSKVYVGNEWADEMSLEAYDTKLAAQFYRPTQTQNYQPLQDRSGRNS